MSSSRRRSLVLPGIGGLMAGLLLVGGAIAGIGIYRSGADLARVFQTAAEPVDEAQAQTVVVDQIQQVGTLTTTIFTMETVVPATSTRQFVGVQLGETSLVYVANGKVSAGIDLAQVTADQVEILGNVIRVTLPAPEILDKQINVARSDVASYDRGFWGLGPDRAPELQVQAQNEALQELVFSACEEGILTKASEEAKTMMSQILGVVASDFELVIEVEPSRNRACL